MILNYNKSLHFFKLLHDQLVSSYPNFQFTYKEPQGDCDAIILVEAKDRSFKEFEIYIDNNDEFFLCINSNFCTSWFPCDEEEKVAEFKKALFDFMDGKARIIETFRGSKCIKAEMQIFENGDWKTVASQSQNLFCRFFIWLRKEKRIIQLNRGTNVI